MDCFDFRRHLLFFQGVQGTYKGIILVIWDHGTVPLIGPGQQGYKLVWALEL